MNNKEQSEIFHQIKIQVGSINRKSFEASSTILRKKPEQSSDQQENLQDSTFDTAREAQVTGKGNPIENFFIQVIGKIDKHPSRWAVFAGIFAPLLAACDNDPRPTTRWTLPTAAPELRPEVQLNRRENFILGKNEKAPTNAKELLKFLKKDGNEQLRSFLKSYYLVTDEELEGLSEKNIGAFAKYQDIPKQIAASTNLSLEEAQKIAADRMDMTYRKNDGTVGRTEVVFITGETNYNVVPQRYSKDKDDYVTVKLGVHPITKKDVVAVIKVECLQPVVPVPETPAPSIQTAPVSKPVQECPPGSVKVRSGTIQLPPTCEYPTPTATSTAIIWTQTPTVTPQPAENQPSQPGPENTPGPGDTPTETPRPADTPRLTNTATTQPTMLPQPRQTATIISTPGPTETARPGGTREATSTPRPDQATVTPSRPTMLPQPQQTATIISTPRPTETARPGGSREATSTPRPDQIATRPASTPISQPTLAPSNPTTQPTMAPGGR